MDMTVDEVAFARVACGPLLLAHLIIFPVFTDSKFPKSRIFGSREVILSLG